MIIDFRKKALEKRKKIACEGKTLSEKEIKEFTTKFNEVAKKYLTYDPDKDPVLKEFREKMKNWNKISE